VSRLARITGGSGQARWGLSVFGVTLVLIGLPLSMLLYGSFRSAPPGAPGGALTAANWVSVFTTPVYLHSLLDLLVLAAGATILATVIGTWLGFLVARTNIPARATLEVLILIPIFMSTLASAIAWVILASPKAGFLNAWAVRFLGLPRGPLDIFTPAGAIWVLGIAQVPYAFLFTAAAFRSIDPHLEEAGRMAGAGVFTTFRKVILPLVAPSIWSAALLVFVLSAAEFAVPGLLGRQKAFLPLSVMVWQSVAHFPANYGVACVLSLLLLFISLALLYPYRSMLREAGRFVTITARGSRPRLLDLGPWRYPALASALGYILVGVVLPYAALFLGAFLRYLTPKLTLDLFTWNNFVRLASQGATVVAVRNSFLISLFSATLVVVFGGGIAWFVLRSRITWRGAVDYLVMVPLAVPGIVMGVGFLWVFMFIPGALNSVWALVVAFITRHIPYAVRSFSSVLVQIDPELEESAQMVGASVPRIMGQIVLPLVRPAVFASWILLFILMIREISSIITLYTPRTTVMSILMWDLMENGDYTMAAALALLQSVLIVAVLVVVQKVLKVKLSALQM
jgi:iron(III) transport system permease protein